MINWKEYPKNKPDKSGDYLVWLVSEWCTGRVGTAYWTGDIFTAYPYSLRATHFTEINAPTEPINQPSLYNCC
jgi:hypothetical protein